MHATRQMLFGPGVNRVRLFLEQFMRASRQIRFEGQGCWFPAGLSIAHFSQAFYYVQVHLQARHGLRYGFVRNAV